MSMLGLIDPLYFIIMIPGFLLATYATMKVKTTFAKYSKVGTYNGLTGAQVAAQILKRNGIRDVQITETTGMLSDHYDPRSRVVRLSPAVYRESTVAAVAVAAHEVGHAIQHAKGYAPLALRSASVPLARLGSFAPWIILVGGFLLQIMELVYFGIILFSVTVFFQLITLPVELNASSRAKQNLLEAGLVNQREAKGVNSVLSAAAMTYVAALISTLLTLLYYLIRLGLLGNRR